MSTDRRFVDLVHRLARWQRRDAEIFEDDEQDYEVTRPIGEMADDDDADPA